MSEEKEIIEVDTTLEAVIELALAGIKFDPTSISQTESFDPNTGIYNRSLSFSFYIEPDKE